MVSHGKILIIEDNLGDARLVEIFLEQTDLIHFNSIEHCFSLRDAFELLEKETFAAVLLDIHLPDSHGISTLENLLERFPEINVVLMTGFNDRQIGLQAIQKGAQDFLVKGEFQAPELAKTVNYSIERHKIIKKLEETQRTTHIGHWEVDLQNNSFTASEEVFRIFGTTSKESSVSYEFAISMIHPDDVEEAKATAKKLLNEKVTVKKDLRIIRRNDDPGYISLTAKVVNVVDGKVTKVSGVLQDITQIKLNELERLRGKQRYENIFNSSKDAIYVKQKVGGFLDFNDASLDLFGYTAEELKSIDYNALFDDPTKRLEFEKIIETGESVSDFAICINTKSGEKKNCLLTANQMRPEGMTGYHESVLSYHVIIRDISDIQKAEQFKKEKEIAERQSKMREELLANVSHEMRTPMNAIFGFTNLLLDDNLQEEQKKLVNLILSSSNHLMKIINDILDVSKQTNNDIEFEEAPMDFKTMVLDLEHVFENHPSKSKNVAFKVEYGQELPAYIMGDPKRINQVLLNFCNNAVKFTEEGFVKLSAQKIGETADDVSIRVVVKDTGIGIKEDHLPIIFQPFTRVANSKEKLYEGTGLGLSITKAVIEQLGGTINVKSELGKGSEFSFDLTFAKCKTHTINKLIEEPDNFQQTNDQPLQILLVEDNNLNQMVAQKTILRQWPNASVDIAANGQIAIEQMIKNEYDVVLMDIQMPVMDGIEATKCIRETLDSPKCDVPIIAMTAHKNVKDDDKHIQYKMNDCILKPFEPQELFSIIQKYTSKKKQMESPKENKAFEYIDLSYTNLCANDDLEFKMTLIESVLTDTPPHLVKLNNLAIEEQWAELQQVSHLLKSSFPFIGNKTLITSNEEIDKKLKDWKDSKMSDNEILGSIPSLVETVCVFFNHSIKEVFQEYQRLGGTNVATEPAPVPTSTIQPN